MATYIAKGAGDVGLAIIVGLLIGLVAAQLVNPTPSPANAAQSAPNCQYPDRWSNPPGGCDNSDPAVPECIKAFSTKEGEDACIAAFVAEHEQPAVVETITPAQPTEVAQCGGK